MPLDKIKDPTYYVQIDDAVRKYNHSLNAVGRIPNVGVNNRFIYSPRMLTIGNQGGALSAIGLIDRTMVMPFNIDPIAVYTSMMYFQNFCSKKYVYSTGSSTPADFVNQLVMLPPVNTSNFMNGVRGVDADQAVQDVLDYTNGNKDVFTVYAPLWNIHTAPRSNEWGFTPEGGNNEFGIRCGPVNILEWFTFNSHTIEDGGGKLSWRDMDYHLHEIDATIDSIVDWIYDTPEHRSSSISVPMQIEDCTIEYKAVPRVPAAAGILDFKVEIWGGRSGSLTYIDMNVDMPKKVAFSNLTPYPIELTLYCHPYNWYYTQSSNGRYYTNSRCRNDFLRGDRADTRSIAETWANARSKDAMFYDFGTGLKAYDSGEPYANVFTLSPFETRNIIDIQDDDIFRSDSSTGANFHGWDGLGYYYNSSNVRQVSSNPYNSGAYGFWINLNECCFRLAR